MPSRAQVQALVSSGLPYEEIGARLGIAPGLAYLIATGLPADGSDVLSAEELEGRPGLLSGSTQHLSNPGTELPKHQASVEEWMVARAQRDAAMQAAASARSAEPPPISADEDTDDVVSVLGWDHNQVNFLLEQLQTIPGVRQGGSEAQQRQRASIVDMITERLSAHEAVEEGHFWPEVRAALAEGEGMADEALAQEQRGKDLLAELGSLEGTEERFDELVEELSEALRKHVAFEDTVFLTLVAATSEEQRAAIGRAVKQAKGHAPTRPHPHAPSEGVAARAAAAMAAPLDKARDALGSRPAEHEGRSRPEPPAGER